MVDAFVMTTKRRPDVINTLMRSKSLDNTHHEVRQLLDTELATDFFVSSDNTGLVAQVLWSSAAGRSRHRPAATALYERLLP